MNEHAVRRLKEDFMGQNWEPVYREDDLDKAYEKFLNIFKTVYDRNCPRMRYKNKKNYSERPWMSKGLQNACKKKNVLYKQFIKDRSKKAEEKYKTYKNKLTEILRRCKKLYYSKILEDNKNNIRGTWNILNKLIRNSSRRCNYPQYFMDNDTQVNKLEDVVEKFNRFFVNVGPSLAGGICTDDTSVTINNNTIERNMSSMFLKPIAEEEIIEIVNKCGNKTSSDSDGITMTTVKWVIEGICKPLTHIFNMSFRLGQFPNNMKIAKVIPLYKSGDKHNLTNYRPISLLSQFSKILEKLFNNRLDTFIDKHNILSDCQYGFRSKRSTSLAITDLMEDITSAMDEKKYTMGIFIDLKKAFDTVNHELLMDKLDKYGIRGMVGKWIRSYLTQRRQFVRLGEYQSSELNIVCGVPQGSVLGPKLFILYINDICKVSETVKMVLFADDTTIWASDENLQQLSVRVSEEFGKIKKWCDNNLLSLNLEKTKYMVFGNRRPHNELQLRIGGANIERVYEIKFLGVMVDDRLSWKSHIRHVRNKMAKNISILARVRHMLDVKALRILYCSLILPYLEYGVENWGNTYRSSLQPLYILQKRAIRVVHKMGYRDHTNVVFIRSKLLKFFDLVEYKTAVFMYKARNNLLPGGIQKLFGEREGGYNLRGHLNLKVHAIRTTKKRFCISISGVKLWNNLTVDMKNSTRIKEFKYKYKCMCYTRYMQE
uniref:Reverse transcriptase domain-containing protein n=1 Tax=Monopterus albus TaxID=43700 RepID=A0A3Q3KL62_MONAL